MIFKYDDKNRFRAMFNPDTGFYMRTGVLDDDGNDTGVDPFMTDFPELLDIGIMQTCVCSHRCNVDCYQKACDRTGNNMSVKDFESILRQCDGRLLQCLDQNEVVLVKDKSNNVKSIAIKDIRVGNQIYCGDNRFAKVLEKYEKESDVFDIELTYGRHIIATKEHRFPTKNGLKRVEELSIGDILLDANSKFNIDEIKELDIVKMIIDRGLDSEFFLTDCPGLSDICSKHKIHRTNNRTVRIDQIKEYLDEIDYYNAMISREKSKYQCNAIYKIDENFMVLLGNYIGNGSHRTYTVSDKQVKMISSIEKSLNSIFPEYKYSKKNGNNTVIIEMNSKLLHTMFFDKILECRTNDNKKQLPNFIFSVSKKNKIAFLRGYFCDGNLKIEKKDGYYGSITFNTSSEKLYKDVCLLLSSLDVHYRITTEDAQTSIIENRTIYKHKRYRISINNLKELHKIKEVVLDHYKSDEFIDMINKDRNDNYLRDYKDNIIKSITKLDKTSNVVDINIDSDDHLFITSHGIISHNCALGGAGDVDTHENFEDILRLCREYNIVPNFTTSGIMMTKEKAEICKKYCGAVAVSEHFADYTDKALDLLLEAGVKTNIHYVLGNKTIDTAIDRLKNDSFKDGIANVVFLLYKNVGKGRIENVLSPDDPRVAEFFDLIDNRKFHHGIGFDSCTCAGIVNFTKKINLESIDYCEGGRFSAYIDANMNMMPCSFANQDPSWHMSLREHSIDEVWHSELFDRFRYPLKNSCSNCPNRLSCGGGCPIVNNITLCNRNEKEFIKQ